jgi:hypothetical protein
MLGNAAVIVDKIDHPIDALVAALLPLLAGRLAADGPGIDQG